MSDVKFFSAVTSMAEKQNSLYKNTTSDRRILYEFMEVNEWFGATLFENSRTPILTSDDFEKLKYKLTLWLYAYRRSGIDKIRIMLDNFRDIYPITCQFYNNFIIDNHLENEPAAWQLLDYIFSKLNKEITAYNENDLEDLIKSMDNETPLVIARTFGEFLKTIKRNNKPITNWVYNFEAQDNTDVTIEAYPLNDFAIMAYCTFNEEIWIRQKLIEKAIKSRRYADLWLFTAFHFICALRLSDVKRLPAPKLPYNNEVMLKKISENTFGSQEASALVDELAIRIKLKPMKPSKTFAQDNVPELKLFVPESLKIPFGIILAINLAHHPEVNEGEAFAAGWYNRGNRNLLNMRNFFGDDFANALKNRNFSSRRANKSYLQGIEAVVGNDNVFGKPKGYMLAALARSHKSGIGTLSKITDIYLKDARFTGYTPEFIIREMFERGVFSFIPAILLEMYMGNEYKALPVRFQTKLIGQVGIVPHQIELISTATDVSLEKSMKAIGSVLRDPTNIRENIFTILQNIASGNAPSRKDEYLCLLSAAELPCTSIDRTSCIGCGYEIYTKSAIHSLMKEYIRLSQLKSSEERSDIWRYQKILEQTIIPAVSEMVNAIKLLYQGADMSDFLNIIERGLNYADSDA